MKTTFDKTDNSIRSVKVRELLGAIPSKLVTWGIVIIIAILMALIMIVSFIPYPHSKGESILQHLLFF